MSHQDPAYHEIDAFWWFTDNGLSPYWALTQLSIQDLDGYAEIQREFGGEEWQIRFSYNSETGLAPRPSDPIDGDTVYEWKMHVENVFTEAKADYVVSPRWGRLKKPNGDQAQIPWCGGEGCQIHLQGSNLSFDEYQWLLQRSLQELADHAGTDFSTRYFNQIRGDSNINTLERYDATAVSRFAGAVRTHRAARSDAGFVLRTDRVVTNFSGSSEDLKRRYGGFSAVFRCDSELDS